MGVPEELNPQFWIYYRRVKGKGSIMLCVEGLATGALVFSYSQMGPWCTLTRRNIKEEWRILQFAPVRFCFEVLRVRFGFGDSADDPALGELSGLTPRELERLAHSLYSNAPHVYCARTGKSALTVGPAVERGTKSATILPFARAPAHEP